MTTAGDFLLPDMTLVIECVVFAIVLFVLYRAALPRLRNIAEERRQRLEEAERSVVESAVTRAEAARQAHRVTTEARAQAREILDRAWARHDQLIAEGRRKGREEYEWMAGRAEREAARAKRNLSLTPSGRS